MATNYISIKNILDKLMRNPLLTDITLEQVVDYTIDFFGIVGIPDSFIKKSEEIEIEKFRAKLPCDFIDVIQVLDLKNNMCIRYNTSSFPLNQSIISSIDNTFFLQNDIIYTSFEKGKILVSYNAILVDDDGYPMIPNNSNFIRALQEYIKKEIYLILFEMGKINQAVFQNTQQQYAWAVGSCETEMLRLDPSKAMSFGNSFRSLIIRDNDDKNGYVNLGKQQIIRIK